jgi:hypothetical protein
MIEGSNNSISASSPQTLGGTDYGWASWSDGGAHSHNVIASAGGAYTAAYQARPPAQSANLVLAKTGAMTGGNAVWNLT